MRAAFDKAHLLRHRLLFGPAGAFRFRIDDKHRHATVRSIRNHPGGIVAKDVVSGFTLRFHLDPRNQAPASNKISRLRGRQYVPVSTSSDKKPIRTIEAMRSLHLLKDGIGD